MVSVAALEQKFGVSGATAGRWLARGALSIADQALVSGSNFLLVVLFGRWLAPAAYGAVAIGLAVFLLAANFHHALLLEPMSVLGPRRFSARLAGYFGSVLRLHAVAVSMLGLLLLTLGAVAGKISPDLGAALSGLSVCTPLVLTFWVLRRFCYVSSDPGTAVRGGAAFMVVAMSGAWVVRNRGWQGPAALFLIIGVAACAACLALLPRIGARLDGRPEPIRLVITAHWRYGRWMAGVSLTYWVANSVLPVMLGWSAGLAAAAGLRALENLVGPVLQATGALNLLLLPLIAGRACREGSPFLKRYQLRAMVGAGALVGSYVLAVLFFRRSLLDWIYGSNTYASFAPVMPLIAAAVLVRGISDLSLSVTLKAIERPDAHLFASLASAVFVLTGGWWLVERWRVGGAAATMLASQLIQVSVLAAFFLRLVAADRKGVASGCE